MVVDAVGGNWFSGSGSSLFCLFIFILILFFVLFCKLKTKKKKKEKEKRKKKKEKRKKKKEKRKKKKEKGKRKKEKKKKEKEKNTESKISGEFGRGGGEWVSSLSFLGGGSGLLCRGFFGSLFHFFVGTHVSSSFVVYLPVLLLLLLFHSSVEMSLSFFFLCFERSKNSKNETFWDVLGHRLGIS